MTHVTCRLTAKNRDQLRNPTLGYRVWATFTFLMYLQYTDVVIYLFSSFVEAHDQFLDEEDAEEPATYDEVGQRILDVVRLEQGLVEN